MRRGIVLQVPLEATLRILLWIGDCMTAQAFRCAPVPHALAVAMGLIPSLAAWLLVQIENDVACGGTNLVSTAYVRAQSVCTA